MEDKMIFEAICKAQEEIKSIGKGRKNDQQGYSFRGIDDVYNYIQPIFAKVGIFTTPEVIEDETEERRSRNGALLLYRKLKMVYTFYAKDGSSIRAVVIGEGMDSGDKASNKAMAVAHKYALLQVFAIPTDEPKDPENESPEPLPQELVKERRKIRADVNKALKEVRDEKAFGKLKTGFEQKYPALWLEQTCVRANETYAQLFDEHSQRVMKIRSLRDQAVEKINLEQSLEKLLTYEAKIAVTPDLDCQEIKEVLTEQKIKLGWEPEGEQNESV